VGEGGGPRGDKIAPQSRYAESLAFRLFTNFWQFWDELCLAQFSSEKSILKV